MLRCTWIVPAWLFALGCTSESGSHEANRTPMSGGMAGAPTNPGSGGATSGGNGASNELDPQGALDLTGSACAGLTIRADTLPAVLQLVVDTSASMSLTTPATQGKSKWSLTREALREVIATLPASTAVGVLYYPNMPTSASLVGRDVSACVNIASQIPIELLGDADSEQRRTIDDSLTRTRPNGSTPTHDAYEYALSSGLEPTTLSGDRYMLVITDGAPTLSLGCLGPGIPQFPQPTQPIIDDILNAQVEHRIRTFLIGSPGSEDNGAGGDMRPWLSTAAVLGGTASAGCNADGPNYCHVDLVEATDFASALRTRLAEIAGRIVSCSFELPEPPLGETFDTGQINVIYRPGDGSDALLVGQNPDVDCYQGWQLYGNSLQLCGQTCERIRRDTGAQLELLFGCETRQVPAH